VIADPQGRRFPYLRLSITPVCNFRCGYCLPNGNPEWAKRALPLTLPEIRRLVRGFAAMGVTKIRLTGGEPTLRPDVVEIAAECASTPGIRRIALTTNGYRLPALVPGLRRAGVRALNVSVDSLKPEHFHHITGADRLPTVLEGIDLALSSGFEAVKINTVLLKGVNDHEVEGFVEWVRDRDADVRFIELMPTADGPEYFARHHQRLSVVRDSLIARGWGVVPRQTDGGPAEVLSHPDYQGRVGLIRPFAEDFCSTCNRLRVTALGELKLCLFGTGQRSLRPWLQEDGREEELGHAVAAMLLGKTAGHGLHEGDHGDTRNLAAMGG